MVKEVSVNMSKNMIGKAKYDNSYTENVNLFVSPLLSCRVCHEHSLNGLISSVWCTCLCNVFSNNMNIFVFLYNLVSRLVMDL